MNWKYGRKDIINIEDIPEGAIGFVYFIVTSEGKSYIGKKSLYSTVTRHFGKKEKALITDKRLKTYEKVTKESNWKTYNGSSELMKLLPKDGSVEIKRKIIIEYAYSNIELTYLETKTLFDYNVLKDDRFYNANILGKFFKQTLNKKDENSTNIRNEE